MINALIVVGKNIKFNYTFMDYLERKVREKVGHLDVVYHLDKNDTDLFTTLDEIIHRHKYIIIATRDAYSLVSKIISTLTDDSMVLKEDILVPSKAIKFMDDSYLISHHDKLINVMKIKEHEELAPIMIGIETSSVSFFLVEAESEKEQEILASHEAMMLAFNTPHDETPNDFYEMDNDAIDNYEDDIASYDANYDYQ